MSKLYKITFKEPIEGKTDFFFGSLSAIYDTFTAEQVGCSVSRLWNIGVSKGTRYSGAKCDITVEELIRKQTKRGRAEK